MYFTYSDQLWTSYYLIIVKYYNHTLACLSKTLLMAYCVCVSCLFSRLFGPQACLGSRKWTGL